MNIDLQSLSPASVYGIMIQTVIPRPIAWVLSENEDGRYNLAPFSYFNAVCSDPPLVMLSIGHKPDGSEKDTRRNIRERSHFVAHLAHPGLVHVLSESSATLPPNDSEVERLGLATVPFEGSALPRLVACRTALACERYDYRELGPGRQALILGLVRRIYIDDAAARIDVNGRVQVAADRIEPLGRLGGHQYLAFGRILAVPRPA